MDHKSPTIYLDTVMHRFCEQIITLQYSYAKTSIMQCIAIVYVPNGIAILAHILWKIGTWRKNR